MRVKGIFLQEEVTEKSIKGSAGMRWIMAIKKGLGKGMDMIIPTKSIVEEEKKNEDVKFHDSKGNTLETLVNINSVEPNRFQPRKNFNEDSLQELAESIKQHGIVQPLIVSRKRDYYEIIAGERRWRAAKLAGLKEVPVIVKDYTSQEIVEIALIENIQREDLNAIEEAQAYQRLIKEYNLKQDDVAERVSKSRTTITNSLRLLKLDERVQQMLIEEFITSGHARALLTIPDGDLQYNIATKIFDEKLSVRETEKLMKKISEDKPEKTGNLPLKNDFIYADLEEKLKTLIGTKVKINRKNDQKGKIEINYYSEEELDRIISMIMGI